MHAVRAGSRYSVLADPRPQRERYIRGDTVYSKKSLLQDDGAAMRGTMDGDVAAERQLIAVERLLARIPQPQRATPVNFLAPPSRTDPPYTHLFRWFSPLFCGLYHCRWWCPPCLYSP